MITEKQNGGHRRFGGHSKDSKRSLGAEITAFTMITSVCTLLLLGTAMILVYLFSFLGKAQADIEYILHNTGQQFNDKIQFVEDGAVTIRHNTMLQGFFSKDQYSEKEAATQLSYSMELFSDRNMVQQQMPFVVSVCLFNNREEYISENYYPMTVVTAKRKEEEYQKLLQVFKKSGKQYYSSADSGDINMCFRVYDDNMKEMGICIVGIQQEAVEQLFGEIESYRSSSWRVCSADGETLISYGEDGSVRENMLSSAQTCGFGMGVSAAVGKENVYNVLKPTLLIFAAVLLLALALAAALAFGISYRFTRPLKKVAESLGAFGQEDFDVRMGDFPIREFHDIGVVFNEMAERIKYLITQVYEKQILATQSQVKYLQSQINPHFQFNILAMLSIKAKLVGNEELYQCLRAFSKLMQGKIFRGKEIKITVAEELELAEFYLLLQNNRFQGKITYEISYGSQDVKKYLIPRLLIEPLVENAVSHGLEPKDGDGKIKVDIFAKEESLYIVVEDDGVGFDAKEIPAEEKGPNDRHEELAHTHTGWENTSRLLHILYGENHQMKITGKKGEGTRVEIVLPIERGAEDVECNSGR